MLPLRNLLFFWSLQRDSRRCLGFGVRKWYGVTVKVARNLSRWANGLQDGPGYHGCGVEKETPKKEREKAEREGFPDLLLLHFLSVKISEYYHKIYCLLYHFSIILLMMKNKTMQIFYHSEYWKKQFTRIRGVSAILSFTLLWTTWTTGICGLILPNSFSTSFFTIPTFPCCMFSTNILCRFLFFCGIQCVCLTWGIIPTRQYTWSCN